VLHESVLTELGRAFVIQGLVHGFSFEQSKIFRFGSFVSFSFRFSLSPSFAYKGSECSDSVEEEVLGMEAAFTNVGLVPKRELRVVNADAD
jgi:hypothetical protein